MTQIVRQPPSQDSGGRPEERLQGLPNPVISKREPKENMMRNRIRTLTRGLPRLIATCAVALMLCLSPAPSPAAMPVDERVMQKFEDISDSMAQHQSEMERTTSELSAKRSRIEARLEPIESEIDALDHQRPRLNSLPDAERSDATRAFAEQRVEVKSRYLELLTEQHQVDVALYRAFVRSGGAILADLEKYADALKETNSVEPDAGAAAEPIRAFQAGTARALAAIEGWGEMTRSDPRFRALWGTARMLGKAQKALDATRDTGATASAVAAQIIHVRALVDQAMIAQKILETEGSLIQVAAQALTFRLMEARNSRFGGMAVPTVDFEGRFDRITTTFADQAEESSDGEDTMLVNFDSCADLGVCD